MRPAILCKLTKGKILDAHPGFVDTFNWLVDFCVNLIGEGQEDSGKSDLVVDRRVDDHPVIRGGSKRGGGGGGVKVVGTDGTYVSGVKELRIASGSDSNVTATVAPDSDQDGVATLTINVYYK